MKLAITILSNRDHKPAFTACLGNLLLYTGVHGSSFGIESAVLNPAQNVSCLSQGRQAAIRHAKSQECTDILFIDDDMTFPPNALEIMAKRDVPIIGVNYVCKSLTYKKCTASAWGGEQLESKGKTGIESVPQLGFGMILFRLSILDSVPAPHFEVKWDEATQDYITDDIYFFRKLTDAGINLHIDHDVSQKVGHVGDFIFNEAVYV